MVGFSTALENFFFKFFHFDGRASRAEFWWVMPTIWAFILFIFWLDLNSVWEQLRSRETPSLNPLTYTWLQIYLFTLLPRLSLSARRLHDSGKSAFWLILPYVAVYGGLMVALGLATTRMTAGDDTSMAYLSVFLGAVFLFSDSSGAGMELFWETVFVIAQHTEPQDIVRLVFWVLSDTSSIMPEIANGLAQNVTNPSHGFEIQLAFRTILLLAIPPFAMFGYLYLMLFPSENGRNRFGEPPSKSGPSMKNRRAYAGYANLRVRTPEEMQRQQTARQQEVKALYRERVLNQRE